MNKGHFSLCIKKNKFQEISSEPSIQNAVEFKSCSQDTEAVQKQKMDVQVGKEYSHDI